VLWPDGVKFSSVLLLARGAPKYTKKKSAEGLSELPEADSVA
jgi:hypothetical protein